MQVRGEISEAEDSPDEAVRAARSWYVVIEWASAMLWQSREMKGFA
jgi:hypothetical protein